jgi:hypothetical protein
MIINLSYDPTTVNATTLGSATNLAAFETQVNAAAKVFENTYLDPVTINITVRYAAAGPNGATVGLAQTLQSFYSYSAQSVDQALKSDITSLDDLNTFKVFPNNAVQLIYLTHAQLKALGFIAGNAAGTDGTITFTNSPGMLDFTHSSAMSSTSYDLFGVAAHEISEIMGRVVDPVSSNGTVLPTEFGRFNFGGNFTIGSDSLLKFNTAATGDRGDWDSTVAASDAFRAFGVPGQVSDISPTDFRAVDVVGWDHKAQDLVFAIDTTGSMGPYIDSVRANSIALLSAAFGTDAAPIDTRIGIVGFKDAAGPSGPGENTAILNFTDQDTYAARKAAAVAAINSISVGGGGDIPEGDNSALLFALQGSLGDWRRAAQDHKIILFTDAPIKDFALADQVAAAAAKLGATISSGGVTLHAGFAEGSFVLSAPSNSSADVGDTAEVSGVFDGPTPETTTFSAHIYAVQVGFDPNATSSLTNLADTTGGTFLAAPTSDDLIRTLLEIINGNTAPSANPDFTHIVFGHQEIVTAPGVLANDIPGTSGDTLTVSAASGSSANVGQLVAGHYGSLQLFSDGHFIYTASGLSALPSSGVSEDFFAYTVLEGGSGGGGSASSTLTMVVTAPGLTYLGGQAGQTIQGPNGHNPVLDGSAGNDVLLAGKGATVLVGGNDDTLTGNKGADTFVFMGPFGQNTITNFNPNKDIIQLDHNEFANFEAVMHAAIKTPSGTVITDPTNSADSITLTGVDLASLHFDAGHFLLA